MAFRTSRIAAVAAGVALSAGAITAAPAYADSARTSPPLVQAFRVNAESATTASPYASAKHGKAYQYPSEKTAAHAIGHADGPATVLPTLNISLSQTVFDLDTYNPVTEYYSHSIMVMPHIASGGSTIVTGQPFYQVTNSSGVFMRSGLGYAVNISGNMITFESTDSNGIYYVRGILPTSDGDVGSNVVAVNVGEPLMLGKIFAYQAAFPPSYGWTPEPVFPADVIYPNAIP